MIERELQKEVLRLAKQFPILAILGPRQSGKTTLAKLAFPHHDYVSLENPNTRAFASEDPEGFLRTYKKGIILDEVQHVPELFSYIQTLVDAEPKPASFILTGSQNFQLNERISQSLAGRVALFTLLPLSISELKRAQLLNPSYEPLLYSGGYPRIHAQKINPAAWYPNYIQTYIERDVRQLKNVADLSRFQRFIKLCAGRIGQIINCSDLGRDCGINYHTVQSWISLLEASFVLFLIYPYYENFNKRVIKAPKLYFYDTGLACSLLEITEEKYLDHHFLKGNLFESFILSELLKAKYNKGQRPHFYFWKDKQGYEIDLIIETPKGPQAIEIKSSETLSSDAFKEIRYWQNISGYPASNCFVVYGAEEFQNRTHAKVYGWQKAPQILV